MPQARNLSQQLIINIKISLIPLPKSLKKHFRMVGARSVTFTAGPWRPFTPLRESSRTSTRADRPVRGFIVKIKTNQCPQASSLCRSRKDASLAMGMSRGMAQRPEPGTEDASACRLQNSARVVSGSSASADACAASKLEM